MAAAIGVVSAIEQKELADEPGCDVPRALCPPFCAPAVLGLDEPLAELSERAEGCEPPAFSDDETRGVTSLPVSFLAEVLRLGGGECSCLLNDPGSLADPLM